MLGKFVFVVFLCKLISSKMQEPEFDVDDLLSAKLMPMSLMLHGDDSDLKNVSQQTLDDEYKCATKEQITGKDGTFNNAFSSLSFHRKMINNYLCSKFIAEQILDEIQPNPMKRRLGIAKSNPESEFIANNSLIFDGGGGGAKTHMLFDEGSNEYKNWLAKTTTLNDIHRNFEQSRKLNDEKKHRRQDQFIDDTLDYKDEYEGGDVTGFMEEKPLTNGGTNSLDQFSQPPATAGSKTGKYIPDSGPFLEPHSLHDLPTLSNGYQYGPPSGGAQEYSYHQPMPYHPPPTDMKAIGIKDLFDIALTALAFLSFGMFIIQVIMCITMAKGYDNSVMLPMEMTADGGEVEAAELEVRVKRSIEEFANKHAKADKAPKAASAATAKVTIKQINNISKRTLQSIEAFVVAKHDRGRCLRKFICENNKFSRKAFDIQKFTIPIFGISLSYMSNKLNNFPITANLENLQASLVGLGNGNCSIYKCETVTISKRK